MQASDHLFFRLFFFTLFVFSNLTSGCFADQDFRTFGSLDQIRLRGSNAHFSGWAVSESKDSIDAFIVEFAGRAGKVYTTKKKEKFYFTLFLPPRDQKKMENALVGVIPLSRGKKGTPLYQLYKPIYPVPTQDISDMVGGGDFLKVGLNILSLLTGYGGLKPADAVLDIGCGLGRVAYPLAYYLSPTARYEGFDVNADLIDLANELVGKYFPNFNFQHVNVYNGNYNPGGNLYSDEFRFPYDDESFDFIFLTSVFTHMLPGDVIHYLEEMNRVLKPNGTCLATTFLLDDESKERVAQQKAAFPFVHDWGNCVVLDPQHPESAVAYDKDIFFSMVEDQGFEVTDCYKGTWDGRPTYCPTFQDVLILKKMQ